MTVDEIMKLADAHAFEAAYYYGSQQDEDEACGKLRAALEAQSARIAELEGLLRRIEPYMDGLICYASTMGEHEPNRIAHDLHAALHPEVKP